MQVLRAEVPAGYQPAGTTLGGLLVLHQASIHYAKMVRFRSHVESLVSPRLCIGPCGKDACAKMR